MPSFCATQLGNGGAALVAEKRNALPARMQECLPFTPHSTVTVVSTLAVTIVMIVISAVTAAAQRKPSEAKRPFVVMSSQSLDDLEKKLQPDNKTEELIDSNGMQLRVAVQHEKNRTGAPAELHDASDDVYYVLDGSATLVLGGHLDDPKETDPGEWRSPRIIDGRTVQIKKGDLVVVPRGTPHQRSTANQDFTMILVKIYQEPLKPKPAAPTAKP